MKTLRLAAAVLASLLALSTTTMANPRLMSPQAAVESNTMVQDILNNLVGEGYVLDNVEQEAQEYLVRPRAPYVWGHLVYTYSRQGHGTVAREKIEVVVKLKYLPAGVAVPELNVRNLAE